MSCGEYACGLSLLAGSAGCNLSNQWKHPTFVPEAIEGCTASGNTYAKLDTIGPSDQRP